MSHEKLAIAAVGAAGRMGQHLLRLAHADPVWRVSGTLERVGHEQLGQDAGSLAGLGPLGIPLTDDAAVALSGANLVVDFSAPAAVGRLASACHDLAVPLIVASTALSDADERSLDQVAAVAPVLACANLSLGVYVLTALVRQAATMLGDSGYDIEVVETHHRHKADAPSGTALQLAETARSAASAGPVVTGRAQISGKREPGSIGIASLRGGEVAGEHTVTWFGPHERIELTHRAASTEVFPAGALKVGKWLTQQAPGRYGMDDFFGSMEG